MGTKQKTIGIKKRSNHFSGKDSGLLYATDWNKTSVKLGYSLAVAFLIVLAMICLLPTIWILISGMKDIKEFYLVPPRIIPEKLYPSKIIDTWKKINFLKYYINTLVLALGSVVFAIIFNGLTGYVLSKLKPPGSAFLQTVFFWTLLLPATLSIVTLYKNIISMPILGLNLSNTYIPMWMLAGASAYTILVFKNFFDTIPISLVEAAKIDGSGNLGIFFKIIFPMSLPIFIVVTIFTINGTWGDFLLPYIIINDPDNYPIMVKIFTMKGATGFSIDIQYISVALSIIPPVILFLFFQKHIMHGFVLSGIKE